MRNGLLFFSTAAALVLSLSADADTSPAQYLPSSHSGEHDLYIAGSVADALLKSLKTAVNGLSCWTDAKLGTLCEIAISDSAGVLDQFSLSNAYVPGAQGGSVFYQQGDDADGGKIVITGLAAEEMMHHLPAGCGDSIIAKGVFCIGDDPNFPNFNGTYCELVFSPIDGIEDVFAKPPHCPGSN